MSYNMNSSITLLHYVHCPFCIRVRMAFDYAQVPYQSMVVPYNDEKTPLDLCGVKMLPIVKDEEGAMNESLDIIKRYCKDKLDQPTAQRIAEVTSLTDKLGKSIHNLAMPYFIWTPEFDNDSRKYFQNKKEIKRGPFKELMKKKDEFILELAPQLEILEKDLTPFYKSSSFALEDIMIAAHLWALFIVPEFQFSPKIYQYLMDVKKITGFEYHKDYME